MPRYGGGGGGGGSSRSGGYKSSSSKSKSSSSSGSRTFKTMTKDPNAPEKVVVRYPGGLYHTFTWDDCETAEFQSQFPSVKDRPYNCKEILAYAIEYTLYEGSDSLGSRIFRRMLKEDCGGIVVDFDAKKGAATTGSVPN